jgi:hypothetical protein
MTRDRLKGIFNIPGSQLKCQLSQRLCIYLMNFLLEHYQHLFILKLTKMNLSFLQNNRLNKNQDTFKIGRKSFALCTIGNIIEIFVIKWKWLALNIKLDQNWREYRTHRYWVYDNCSISLQWGKLAYLINGTSKTVYLSKET